MATFFAWRSSRLAKEQIELSRKEQQAARDETAAEKQALEIEFDSALSATIRNAEILSDEAILMGRDGRDSVGWVRGYNPRVRTLERDVRELMAQSARANIPVSTQLRAAHALLTTLEQQLAQMVSRTYDHSPGQVYPEGWRNEILGADRYHGKIELALPTLRNAHPVRGPRGAN